MGVIIPLTCTVGHNQPWYVCIAYMKREKKDKESLSKLLNFSYSSKRFDYIQNYQQVDWRLYRKFCFFMKNHLTHFKLNEIIEISKSIKKVKNSKGCGDMIFGNHKVTDNQLKGLDYTPSYYRHVYDHCDKPWYECY
jgi:hypothetical protein